MVSSRKAFIDESQADKAWDKLMDKRQDRNWTFSELLSALKKLGFDLVRIEGSHHHLKSPSFGALNLQPKNNRPKSYQMDQVRDTLKKGKNREYP